MDRVHKGFIAGVIGAIPMNILNLTFFYLFHLTELRFLDWASIILTGSKPANLFEFSYALFVQICWSGVLGVILAFIIPRITSKGFIFKGVLYTFSVAFTLRCIVALFQVPELSQIPFLTSAMNFIASLIWGLTAVCSLRYLDRKYG